MRKAILFIVLMSLIGCGALPHTQKVTISSEPLANVTFITHIPAAPSRAEDKGTTPTTFEFTRFLIRSYEARLNAGEEYESKTIYIMDGQDSYHAVLDKSYLYYLKIRTEDLRKEKVNFDLTFKKKLNNILTEHEKFLHSPVFLSGMVFTEAKGKIAELNLEYPEYKTTALCALLTDLSNFSDKVALAKSCNKNCEYMKMIISIIRMNVLN